VSRWVGSDRSVSPKQGDPYFLLFDNLSQRVSVLPDPWLVQTDLKVYQRDLRSGLLLYLWVGMWVCRWVGWEVGR